MTYGQTGGVTLTIKGDMVVFQCSSDKLDSLYAEKFSLVHDFDSLKLSQAIQSKSSFEKLANQWTFHYIQGNVFELRKPLDDFEEEYDPFDKYLLFTEYWQSPRSQLDTTTTQPKIPFQITEEGNARFFLKGNQRAEKVILAGTFNHWNEEEISMIQVDNGWQIDLELAPGIYEYKFIIDGKWTHDVLNSLKLRNEHQTWNSILLIGEKIKFSFTSDENIRKVFLAGSFNNWDDQSIPLEKNGNTWTTTLELPPGKHYYKFIVGREWVLDPENDLMEVDNEGISNSVLIIN
ncbi:hypothetical protein GCM10007940_15890 [Portibacter lacus]|uniref:AMP-activated protein kinase glycogen-binding domain-containing protein n=1 Tax=Portibacter lacus TaxID=1099794 RepID=A0AA37SPV3_9BACT|nr:hypothetical protein GCM10007940_15890 [Portibacter lacus]